VYRLGGDEFLLVLPRVDLDEGMTIAERIRAGVEDARPGGLDVTISIGVASAHGSEVDYERLFAAADAALYAAKRAGRNRVSLLADAADVPRSEPEAIGMARALAHVSGLGGGSLEGHTEVVADLAGRIAERLGLPAAVVLRCQLGGWLHDVGKAAVPARILDKPGPLDDAEWAVMETHPVVGEAIVRGVAALREAAAAVRHHHERYDGTGYPDRLAGAAIPIEARIVAAADAYAAMTADRPYSAARTPAQTAIGLQRCSRTQLDPRVVHALLAELGLPTRPALRVA
jgi:putative nucleotidyltransferase with HDIG domain